MNEYTLRTARMEDLGALAELEALCFPPAEAASRETLEERLRIYPDRFLLLTDGDQILSFVNGFTTDLPDLTDEMYTDPALHDPKGAWQMIFGLDTRPDVRGRGLAGMLIRRYISDAGAQGRKGLVLTCKESLLSYYSGFGFRDEGISGSVHGGAVWHQMRYLIPGPL